MAVVDANNLATRMRRISELTRAIMSEPIESPPVHTLAERIRDEIAIARLQIRLFTPTGGAPHVLRFLP
ncbi:MAG TPA: hypothetical protein VLV86_06210 [Vicinamibacterales bacterium]|nr:hypothetical protein [Vicinamibacterales bacterium]